MARSAVGLLLCILSVAPNTDAIRLARSPHPERLPDYKNAEVVVASYCNDDHAWLADVNCDRTDIYVYSKCQDQEKNDLAESQIKGGTAGECAKFVRLDNIGRESETFLQHMITHYDRLGKQHRKLFFLQGSKEWSGGADEVNDVAASMDHTTRSKVNKLGFTTLHVSMCGTRGLQLDTLVNLYKFYQHEKEFNHFVAPLRSEFMVSSERLSRVPKWLLSHTRQLLVSDPASKDTAETSAQQRDDRGHVVERVWGMMFGCWSHTKNVEDTGDENFKHSSTYPLCLDKCEDGKACGPNANVPFEGQDAPMGEAQFVEQILTTESDHDVDLAMTEEKPCGEFQVLPSEESHKIVDKLQLPK